MGCDGVKLTLSALFKFLGPSPAPFSTLLFIHASHIKQKMTKQTKLRTPRLLKLRRRINLITHNWWISFILDVHPNLEITTNSNTQLKEWELEIPAHYYYTIYGSLSHSRHQANRILLRSFSVPQPIITSIDLGALTELIWPSQTWHWQAPASIIIRTR